MIEPSRPSSSSSGGRSWLMKVRTSPSSRRRSSRRKRSSLCATRSVLVEHPLDVLDLEDGVGERLGRARRGLPGPGANARPPGPGRCASACPSASPASATSASRLASPRSRKSQAFSMLRTESSSLESSCWCSPRSAGQPLDLGAQRPLAGVLGAGLGRGGRDRRPRPREAGRGRRLRRWSRRRCQRPRVSRYASRYRSVTERRLLAP